MTEIGKHLTCDRCGSTITLHLDKSGDFYESPPKGWTAVAYQCKTKDLCPTCSELHERFMNGYTVTGKPFYNVR